MKKKTKWLLKEIVLAAADLAAVMCLVMALAIGVLTLVGCSSTSKVVTDTTQRTHVEQKVDSVAHIARRDSVATTNVNVGETVNNVTDREHRYEIHDSTFVIINADGTRDIRTVRNEKETETIHDTLWRTRWRDSVRTEFVCVLDSVREQSYESKIDSLQRELRDKEVVVKEMSWWDKLRQGIMGGIIFLFLGCMLWFYFKIIRK